MFSSKILYFIYLTPKPNCPSFLPMNKVSWYWTSRKWTKFHEIFSRKQILMKCPVGMNKLSWNVQQEVNKLSYVQQKVSKLSNVPAEGEQTVSCPAGIEQTYKGLAGSEWTFISPAGSEQTFTGLAWSEQTFICPAGSKQNFTYPAGCEQTLMKCLAKSE